MKNLFLLVLLLLLSWSTARSLLARDVILTVDSHPAAVAAANKAHELEKKGDLEGDPLLQRGGQDRSRDVCRDLFARRDLHAVT